MAGRPGGAIRCRTTTVARSGSRSCRIATQTRHAFLIDADSEVRVALCPQSSHRATRIPITQGFGPERRPRVPPLQLLIAIRSEKQQPPSPPPTPKRPLGRRRHEEPSHTTSGGTQPTPSHAHRRPAEAACHPRTPRPLVGDGRAPRGCAPWTSPPPSAATSTSPATHSWPGSSRSPRGHPHRLRPGPRRDADQRPDRAVGRRRLGAHRPPRRRQTARERVTRLQAPRTSPTRSPTSRTRSGSWPARPGQWWFDQDAASPTPPSAGPTPSRRARRRRAAAAPGRHASPGAASCAAGWTRWPRQTRWPPRRRATSATAAITPPTIQACKGVGQHVVDRERAGRRRSPASPSRGARQRVGRRPAATSRRRRTARARTSPARQAAGGQQDAEQREHGARDRDPADDPHAVGRVMRVADLGAVEDHDRRRVGDRVGDQRPAPAACAPARAARRRSARGRASAAPVTSPVSRAASARARCAARQPRLR